MVIEAFLFLMKKRHQMATAVKTPPPPQIAHESLVQNRKRSLPEAISQPEVILSKQSRIQPKAMEQPEIVEFSVNEEAPGTHPNTDESAPGIDAGNDQHGNFYNEPTQLDYFYDFHEIVTLLSDVLSATLLQAGHRGAFERILLRLSPWLAKTNLRNPATNEVD